MVHVKQNYHHYNLKQDTLVRKWRMEKLKTRWCVNKVSQISSRTVASNTYEAIANWKVVRFMDKISVRASTQETVLEEAHSYKPIPLILSGRKVMDSKIKKKKTVPKWIGLTYIQMRHKGQTSGRQSVTFEYFSYHHSFLLTSLKNLIQWEMICYG